MNKYFYLGWLKISEWKRNLDGQTLVEYTLIIMLVSAVIFTLLAALGEPLRAFFEKVTTSMSSASG